MKMYGQVKSEGKIISTYIQFGNEIFQIRYSIKGDYWIIFRKEKNPRPIRRGYREHGAD